MAWLCKGKAESAMHWRGAAKRSEGMVLRGDAWQGEEMRRRSHETLGQGNAKNRDALALAGKAMELLRHAQRRQS